jgi:hypothetical protein
MTRTQWWPTLAAVSLAGSLAAQEQRASEWQGPFVEVVKPLVSPSFRDLPRTEPNLEGRADERKPPESMKPRPGWDDAATAEDPLVARGWNAGGRTPSPSLEFQGQSNACGCSPPDPIGAAGPNHYVQMVNATRMQVFDKSNGAPITPSNEFRLLWPVGTNCRNSSNGDPVIVYDWLASRFVLAQFSTGSGVCVAVSQTSDPTGSYNLYEFSTPEFPDYFKIGAWNNAYYMSSNENNYSAYALDRAAMLAGSPATSIRFTGEANFLMPATVVGNTAPPAGTPGIYYTFKDDSFHGGTDRLEFFHFTPDFVTPANSSFGLAQAVNVTSYTYTVCGFFNFNCIPQAGTPQRVDAVSEWPMWQLQYRNQGAGGEKLVANFSVDVGADRSGIRWYEINRIGGTYAIAQEGTHAPGTLHRFMGSIAMDRLGDVALAYSASSSTENPSLRYATRLSTDPAGTLQAEANLFLGGGSQTGSNRWGDYSALVVDPSDDCTFWYTGEYYTTNASNAWTTRIGKFVIPECTVPVQLQGFTVQ